MIELNKRILDTLDQEKIIEPMKKLIIRNIDSNDLLEKIFTKIHISYRILDELAYAILLVHFRVNNIQFLSSQTSSKNMEKKEILNMLKKLYKVLDEKDFVLSPLFKHKDYKIKIDDSMMNKNLSDLYQICNEYLRTLNIEHFYSNFTIFLTQERIRKLLLSHSNRINLKTIAISTIYLFSNKEKGLRITLQELSDISNISITTIYKNYIKLIKIFNEENKESESNISKKSISSSSSSDNNLFKGNTFSLFIIDLNNLMASMIHYKKESGLRVVKPFHKLKSLFQQYEDSHKNYMVHCFASKYLEHLKNHLPESDTIKWYIESYFKNKKKGIYADIDTLLCGEMVHFIEMHHQQINNVYLISGDKDLHIVIDTAKKYNIKTTIIVAELKNLSNELNLLSDTIISLSDTPTLKLNL